MAVPKIACVQTTCPREYSLPLHSVIENESIHVSRIVYVWDLSIFTSGKLFEHTLEVMPVEHADVWE